MSNRFKDGGDKNFKDLEQAKNEVFNRIADGDKQKLQKRSNTEPFFISIEFRITLLHQNTGLVH